MNLRTTLKFVLIIIVSLLTNMEAWSIDKITCDAKIERLKDIERKQNNCLKNDDCKVLTWPTNSYKCFRLAHKKSILTEYKEIMSNYSTVCAFPLYECTVQPSAALCVNGICHVDNFQKIFTKEQAFAILVKKEKIQIPLEVFSARFSEEDKTWTFIENKNQIALPVYIVTPDGKTRLLKGR